LLIFLSYDSRLISRRTLIALFTIAGMQWRLIMMRRLRWPKAVVPLLACAMFPAAGSAQNIPIEPLATYHKLDASTVTVSGISSGAFFAHQFHVAYSALVKGAGIVAGGPYGCADKADSVTPPFDNPFFDAFVARRVVVALAVCTHLGESDFRERGWKFPSQPEASDAQKAAARERVAGKIDDPANLAASRVWLFHGDRDTNVPSSTVQALRSFYQLMGVPDANIETKDGADARHGMPIDALTPGESAKHCKLPDSSFLVRCDYGAAELLLRSLYPDAQSTSPPGPGRLVGFDQTEFFDENDKSTSLNEAGYLYVPRACVNGALSTARCRLHVAFHGCQQYVGRIHDLFIRNAGYNGWADAHNVIVLYPQATQWLRLADPSQLSGNPQGCWDWWGYSGDDYLEKDGKQMRAVRAMIGRMLP